MPDDTNLKQRIIVCDLDGTLCDAAHREHLARTMQWDEFHSLCPFDSPHQDVLATIKAFNALPGYQVVGLTGRNQKYRPITMEWLIKWDVCMDVLLMRPNDDFSPDKHLKPRMLEDFCLNVLLVEPLEAVLFILEDRDKMVEEWRNLGFNCWHVRQAGY